LRRSSLAPITYSWRTYLVLGILLVGPLVGPIFSAIGWEVLAWINWPIYLLGENVCPQPALVFYVFGFPMVVCSRCWAAVFGLWTMLLLYKRTGNGSFWRMWGRQPETLRALVAVAGFWPWVFDIVGMEQGWWVTDHPMLMLSGYLGGLAAGLLLMPLAGRRTAKS
jgi:hypothetical protein